MNADGTNQTRLTTDPGYDLFSTYSPDGQKIAFSSTRDGNFEIYSMDADGTGQTRLTNNPASDTYPAFSPDSSQIAFDSNRDGNDEIYSMKRRRHEPDAADQRRRGRQLSVLLAAPQRSSSPRSATATTRSTR